MGPTNPIFWQIKIIIILISHVNIFLFTIIFLKYHLFLLGCNKRKNKKLGHFILMNHGERRYGCLHKHRFLYLDDQYFYL